MQNISKLFLCFLSFQVSLCHAWEIKQSPVSFIGTWVTESEAIYVESIDGSSGNAAWSEPKLASRKSIIKITKQDGRRFWGVINSANEPTQPFIAIVDPSESTIVAVNERGSIRGKVLHKNAFSYCYTQVAMKQVDNPYVECTIARRQNK